MQLETLVNDASGGWSRPLPAALDSPRTLVLAFGAPAFGRDGTPSGALAEVVAAFPSSYVLGASTAGEIHETKLLDESLVVAVARFDATRLGATTEVIDAASSFTAGASIARALAAPDLAGVLVLSEGVSVNGSELVRGINAQLPATVVVIILCDLMMPDLTGMDLYDELAARFPESLRGLVFLTGGAFTPRAQAFLAAVPNGWLSKPFDWKELQRAVAARLGAPAVAPTASQPSPPSQP